MSTVNSFQPPRFIFEPDFDVDHQWILLRTLARQEKVVAADLSARGIQFFLPLVDSVRYYGRRKINVLVPLFAGYVFLRGSREQSFEIDRSRRVASIIPVVDQGRLNQELQSLSIALDNQCNLTIYPQLAVGRMVEIRSGPLRGVRGYIEQRPNSISRLILNVEILNRALSLEIDASLVDVIE